MENYASKIAHEAKKLRGVHSELLSSMRKVTRFTGYLIPPLGILLFLEAFYLRGDPINDAVVSTAAGLLGMLPKGLVLLISISLAVGIIALSKKKVLVQELFALETLAHVDTLCLDKTGTLTEGKMQVEEVESTDIGRSMPLMKSSAPFSTIQMTTTRRSRPCKRISHKRKALRPYKRFHFLPIGNGARLHSRSSPLSSALRSA